MLIISSQQCHLLWGNCHKNIAFLGRRCDFIDTRFICGLSRAFEDEKQAKLGVVECVKHGLLEPFNVLWEKEGNIIANIWKK